MVLHHQHLLVPALGLDCQKLSTTLHIWILQIHGASPGDCLHVYITILLLSLDNSAEQWV